MVAQVEVNGEQVLKLASGILVASKSRPGAWHSVQRDRDGLLVCDCEAFAFRGACRHIKAVEALERADAEKRAAAHPALAAETRQVAPVISLEERRARQEAANDRARALVADLCE